jgi:N-acetylglucosamine-6-sulfatase
VPPGWDDFVSPTDVGNPYAEYNYQLNDNGHLETHLGIDPKSYLVDVLTRKSRQFLVANAGKQPFFLYVAPYVPHEPATPARRYETRFPGVRAPRPPSYNQRDLSAEPQWLRDLPMIDAERRAEIDGLYQRRLESMLGVEDMLRTIVNTLKRTGQLDDTYIVFTSDNGFHLGEHRLPAGKQTAYDEDIHVPLVIRGPGVPADHVVTHFVNETDLAPTFADLAHAPTPAFVDGASFAPDLVPDGSAVLPKDTLIEHFATAADDFTGELPKNEPDDDAHPPVEGAPQSGPAAPRQVRFASVRIPTYRALRTPDYLYVVYSTGEKQLYDLQADPYELHNLAATADPELLGSLAHRLLQLANCEAATCRT